MSHACCHAHLGDEPHACLHCTLANSVLQNWSSIGALAKQQAIM